MKIKTLLTATFLTVVPGLAMAQGCNSDHGSEQAMSCAAGTQWDAESQSCTSGTTS